MQDKGNMLYGSQSFVHLENIPTYQNGTRHHFVRLVTNEGGLIHTQASCTNMLMKTNIFIEVAEMFVFSLLV